MIYFGDFTSAVTSLGSIFNIFMLLAAAVFALFSAKSKVNIVSLEQSNKILRDSNVDKDTKILALETERNTLKQTAQVLQDLKTQAPDINKLTVQIATQHKQMMAAMAAVTDSNAKMTKEIGNIAKALTKDKHANK